MPGEDLSFSRFFFETLGRCSCHAPAGRFGSLVDLPCNVVITRRIDLRQSNAVPRWYMHVGRRGT